MHCSYGAKLFGFDSTNVAINLYLVVLKIAINFFSTTNTNGSFGWMGRKLKGWKMVREWKSGRIEKNFNFSPFCLVVSGKVE